MFSQKSLNFLVVNWVPLSVIMLLGMLNWYMISWINNIALAAIMEAFGFASIHLVNLSTAMKMCVNPPLSFINGPTRSNPHVEKGQVIGMVYLTRQDVFLMSKILAIFIATNQGVDIRSSRGPIKPLPIYLAHKRVWTCVATTNS
jgi:hypothetical protein